MANAAEVRDKAIKIALGQLDKQFGKGAVYRYGDGQQVDVEVLSSGSISLDKALGKGGYPRGRIVEVYGPEASGKTTLTLHAIAEAQKAGGYCAFVDAEHALDPDYARRIGVQMDDLVITQPDNGENALEITEKLVRSGAFDVIVVDSVAALVPKAEIEGEMGDHHVGLQARLMSQALRKLTAAVHKSNTILFFINQIRMKIGIMFGNPETTTGGNALKFYASQRLDVRRIGAIKQGDQVVGSRHRVKVVKNKIAPPFKQAEFDFRGAGIDIAAECLDWGVTLGLVDKAGAWYSYEGERVGQGRENSIQFLRDNPDVFAKIKSQVMSAVDPTPVNTDAFEDDDEPEFDDE